MKFNFQKKIALFFGISLVVLGLIFFGISYTTRYSANTARSIERMQDILIQTEELRTALIEVQNNEGKDPGSVGKIYPPMIQLKGHAVESSQKNSIDTLAELIQQIIKVASSRKVLIPEAYKRIAVIQISENKSLTDVKSENLLSIRRTNIIINIFIGVTIVLMVIAYLVISRNTRLRNEAEENIREINTSLEKTIEIKAAEAIRKEQQYRFLIENMNEGVQVLGFDWKYKFLNDAAVKQSLYKREDLLDHTIMDKYPGIEGTPIFQKMQRCMMERLPEVLENEFTFPDGSKGWFELCIEPIPEGLFILSLDCTRRKQSEQALTEEKINQQKLITETTIQVQEEERNELGRELHDNINQIQATIKLFLGIAKNDPANQADLLEKCYDYISQAITETRKLSHSLVSPTLGSNSLDEVFQKLVDEVNLVNGLRMNFSNQINGFKMDKSRELMLYRIAQEQIHNIQKYAKAKKAEIRLEEKEGKLVFSISDNGVGFDPSKKPAGIGLKNIRNRVEFYSGEMKIESAPGKGCKLEVMIPV